MKFIGVIPARYASSRFPGKPLIDLGGKSMIQRVYEQAQKAECLSRVVVATDDERIFKHVVSFGGEVIMTSVNHESGTDRCAEVLQFVNTEAIINDLETNKNAHSFAFKPKRERTTFDAVINIQGDEPFIEPAQINQVAEILRGGLFPIASLAKRLTDLEHINNPNAVKVVFSEKGSAMYFSRSPIPFLRNVPQSEWHLSGAFFKHLGLYGYKTTALKKLAELPTSALEKFESLEQLRWLEAGFMIGIGITDLETIGIDTPEDVAKIKHLIIN
jgi:3-deoxy-manno-octulosonate cytidylyltransferase (CMP-KDO synthetase)